MMIVTTVCPRMARGNSAAAAMAIIIAIIDIKNITIKMWIMKNRRRPMTR